MSRQAQENLVAFIFLFFFIAIIVISFNYSERARMVPIPIAVVSIFFVLLQLYFMNFRRDINLNVDATELLTRGKSKEAVLETIQKDELDEVKILKSKAGGTESGAVLMLLIYLALNLLIGILPAMLFFVLGFLIFITKLHWIKAFIAALLTTAGCYVFFVYLLEIKFYNGWLINLFLG